MNFSLSAWVVYANDNPYAWYLSRAAAYAGRKALKSHHPHARFTIEKRDAVLVLISEPKP